MSRARLICLAFCVVVGIGILFAFKSPNLFWDHRGTRVAPFACFSRADVAGFLKAANLGPTDYLTLRRNEARDKIYTCLSSASGVPALVLVSAGGVKVTAAPGSIVYLNSVDEAVAWSNDLSEGVHFASGYFLKLPEHGLFDITPSGEYFIISEKPTSTWIGRTARPELRTCISNNVLASRVFEAGGKLYVAGQAYDRTPNGGFNQAAACLVLSPRTNGFELVNTIRFPMSAGIEDVSETGEQILLKYVTEFSSYWLLSEANTLKTERFESSGEWCFFLKTNPLQTYDAK